MSGAGRRPGGERILGTGIDLADVDRVAAAWARHGPRFVERLLTDVERRRFEASTRPERDLAEAFAVKEAALKALGTGWGRGVGFRDVEALTDGTFVRAIRYRGAAARRLELAGEVAVRSPASVGSTASLAWAWVILAARDPVSRGRTGR